jgi:hypothetical protein
VRLGSMNRCAVRILYEERLFNSGRNRSKIIDAQYFSQSAAAFPVMEFSVPQEIAMSSGGRVGTEPLALFVGSKRSVGVPKLFQRIDLNQRSLAI